MGFEGTFEDLSIVDVLQLLHVTRNEGVLRVKGETGEAFLALKDGFVIVAIHPNQEITVGQTLVDMGGIEADRLKKAEAQAPHDDPIEVQSFLLKTLRKWGDLDPPTTWKAQAKLVEATMLEVLSWETGAFSFDVTPVQCLDDFRLVGESVGVDITGLDIQQALSAALRRSGRPFVSALPTNLPGESGDRPTRPGEMGAWAQASLDEPSHDSFVPFPADDTKVENVIRTSRMAYEGRPSGTADNRPSYSNVGSGRPRLSSIPAIHVGRERRSQTPRPVESRWPNDGHVGSKDAVIPPPADGLGLDAKLADPKRVVLFVSHDWLKEALSQWAVPRGVDLCVAENELEVYQHIQDGQISGVLPVLMVDLAHNVENDVWAERSKSVIFRLRRLRPDLQVAALCDSSLAAQREAYELGVCFPLPRPRQQGDSLPDDREAFLKLVESCLDGIFLHKRQVSRDVQQTRRQISLLKQRMSEVQFDGDLPEISLVLLRYLAEFLERCVVFLVRDEQLCGVGSFGLGHGDGQAQSLAHVNIPLVTDSMVRRVVREGNVFVGKCEDGQVLNPLHDVIGRPHSPDVVLLPLRALGTTIALLYGDYGPGMAARLWVEPLEILMQQAGLVLEVALLRRRGPTESASSADVPEEAMEIDLVHLQK
jgi:hypothetical protein